MFSGLTKLKVLMAGSNKLVALPDGVFAGLTMLDILDVAENPVHPLLLTVTVEMAGSDRVRAKVPAGAPFALSLQVSVTNGGLAGGASTLEIPAGAVEGEAVAVTRTEGTTGAVTVDLGTPLPSPPMGPRPPHPHRGYAFVRAPRGLPVEILPAATAEVRDVDWTVSGPGADQVWERRGAGRGGGAVQPAGGGGAAGLLVIQRRRNVPAAGSVRGGGIPLRRAPGVRRSPVGGAGAVRERLGD